MTHIPKGNNRFRFDIFIHLILVLITMSCLSSGQTPSSVSLETINSFPGQWCSSNDGYIYGDGLNTRKFVFRKKENSPDIEKRGDVTVLNPTFMIENRIYGTSTPGLIFVLVKDDKNLHYLLRSDDGGSTFKNVFAFGEGNGPDSTNTPNVRLLRGLLELNRDIPAGGGKGTLYIGEYNFNDKRTPGSTNDRVRIMKSIDKGETWTKVVEWNTNGHNQIGHIHAMKQDPYTGEIYICIGDSDDKLGLVKWDGSSQWSDNKTTAQIGTMAGFKVFAGAQRYRTVDVLFDENYFYTFADTQTPNNPTGSESGIWRGAKDFSSYTRMDNQIYDYDPMHVGWFGEKIGNTFIFTTAREYVDPQNAWKQLNTQVYTSSDGEHWDVSGVVGWRDFNDPTESKYSANVFSFNNKFYIDCYGGAGHSSTIQCEVSSTWKKEDGPVVLHPVYFVGKWNKDGDDRNSGVNADSPKLTLKSLMTGSNISPGARIKIAKGSFSETGIDADWSNPVFNGRGSVVVEGRGMDSTRIEGRAASNLSGIRVDSAKTQTGSDIPVIFKDLEFSVTGGNGTPHDNYVFEIINSYVKTVRCRLGSSQNDDSPLIRLKSTGAKYVSENSIHNAGEKPGMYRTILTSEAPSSFSFTNCIVLNAYNAYNINHSGVSLSLRNSTFYGIEKSVLIMGPSFNTQPVIKNCIFSSGGAPIADSSGVIENQVDYNYYSSANINVTDGGHGPQIGKDPLFVDAKNGNLKIYANSPCSNDGIFLSDVLTDFNGYLRHNPPCLGALECLSTNAPVADIPIPTPPVVTPPVDTTAVISPPEINPPVVTPPVVTPPVDTPPVVTPPVVTPEPPVVTPEPTVTTPETPVVTPDPPISGNPTGINVNQTPELKVYPNPINDFLTIENPGEDITTIALFDTSGKLRSKEKVNSPLVKLDFSGFQRGMYILELMTSSKTIYKIKVIKD